MGARRSPVPGRPLGLRRSAATLAVVLEWYGVLVLVVAAVVFMAGLFGDLRVSLVVLVVGPLVWALVRLAALVAHDIEVRYHRGP